MPNKQLLPLYLIGLYPVGLILGTLISELITVILSFFIIFEIFKKKNFFLLKDPIIYFLLGIWFYLIINLSFNSVDYNLSFNRSIFFFRYILIILFISYFFTNYYKNIDIVFKLWAITIIITIIDLYTQFFLGQNLLGYVSPWNERLSGFFDQELKVAHLLIGFFLPVFAYYLRKKNNMFLYIIFFSYVVILILTNERANIIRGILAALIFIIFLPLYKKKIKIFFSLTTILIFCSILFFVTPVKNRFINEISAMKVNNSIINYIILSNYGPHYLASLEIYKDNKLFGTGVKTFRIKCNDVSLKKYYKSNDSRHYKRCSTHPHQYYLEILSELGIIGLLLFISFFSYLVYRIINQFLITRNIILLATGLFFIFQLTPLLPTGSFFTSFGSTIFFINLGLIYTFLKKKN
jgi:O-antigen ligase